MSAAGADKEKGQPVGWERACLAWPGVCVDRSAFLTHVRALAASSPEGGGSVHAADLVLAFAAAHRDLRAAKLLDQGFILPLTPVIRRVVQEGGLVQEVQQTLRHSLMVGAPGKSPQLLSYSGKGPLAAYVRAAAVRAAIRLKKAPKEVLVSSPEAPWLNDLELQPLREVGGPAIEGILQEVLRALPIRERVLLRLRFAQGMKVEEIARVYGVNKATASRWLSAALAQVLKETRKKAATRFHLRASEVSSFLRPLRSQLKVSLSELFGTR